MKVTIALGGNSASIASPTRPSHQTRASHVLPARASPVAAITATRGRWRHDPYGATPVRIGRCMPASAPRTPSTDSSDRCYVASRPPSAGASLLSFGAASGFQWSDFGAGDAASTSPSGAPLSVTTPRSNGGSVVLASSTFGSSVTSVGTPEAAIRRPVVADGGLEEVRDEDHAQRLQACVLRVFAEMQVGDAGQKHSVSSARLTLQVMQDAKQSFDALFDRAKCFRMRVSPAGPNGPKPKFHEWMHSECGLRGITLPSSHPQLAAVSLAVSANELRLFPEHRTTEPALASEAFTDLVIRADASVLIPRVKRLRENVTNFVHAFGHCQLAMGPAGSSSRPCNPGMFFGRHLQRLVQEFASESAPSVQHSCAAVSAKVLNSFAAEAVRTFVMRTGM